MSSNIVVVDYGSGNLMSVVNAFKHWSTDVIVSSELNDIKKADALIFPGVGSAISAMYNLHQRDLVPCIIESINKGIPFLAICLGFQLLMDISEEGSTECLGIVPGQTKRFNTRLKVPHMGWNKVFLKNKHPLFNNIPNESYFYFVHSYFVEPKMIDNVLATTEYDRKFCSVLHSNNVIGTQFHPEKSGTTGLLIYKNFIELIENSNL